MTLAVLGLDQATKLAVKGLDLPALGISWQGMNLGESIPLLGDWLKLTFIENPNMAFGIDVGGRGVLTVFAFAASCLIVWYLWKHRTAPLIMRLPLALILAGALGNLVDRTFYGLIFGYAPVFQGNVVDFMDLDLFFIHLGGGGFKFWPIFNVADASVTIGAVLLIFQLRPNTVRSVESRETGGEDDAPGRPNASAAAENSAP